MRSGSSALRSFWYSKDVKKYLSKRFAKKLLIVGAVLYAISLVLNSLAVYSILGTGCADGADTCTLHTEQIVGKIAMVIGYAGIGVFLVGLATLLIVLAKQKKQ